MMSTRDDQDRAADPTRKRENVLQGIVSDTYDYVSPHPLEDQEIFVKVGGNKIFEIVPPIIHFKVRKLKTITKRVKITNVSGRSQRLHILRPKPNSGYSVSYPSKLGTMAPGVTQILDIHYNPKHFNYQAGEVKIHTVSNLRIPLHSYPAIEPINFPKHVDMGNTLLGDTVVRTFTLESKVPVVFEYKITPLRYNPNFVIKPQAGSIKPNSTTKFTINFTPLQQVTTGINIKLEVSQFGFQPIQSSIVGSCTDMARPGDARLPCNTMDDVQKTRLSRAGSIPKFSPTARKSLVKISSSMDEGAKPTVFRMQSGAEMTRSIARIQTKLFSPDTRKIKPLPPEKQEIWRDVVIPDKFTQTAVNSILKFEPGKMTIAEMKEAIKKQQDLQKKREAAVEKHFNSTRGPGSSRRDEHPTDHSSRADTEVTFIGDTDQMREMVFLRKLNDFVEHEKRLTINPTKPRVGQRIITEDQRQHILETWQEERKEAAKRGRKIERENVEHICELSRDKRVVYPIERRQQTTEFSGVNQDDWESRKVALETFIEAMTTLVIRKRVDCRIERLKKAISSSEGQDVNMFKEVKLGFDFKMTEKTLTPTCFPAVGKEEVKRMPRNVKAIPNIFQIRDFRLKESPLCDLLDYKSLPLPALPIYLAPHQERDLRSGALDEHLIPAPSGMATGKLGSIETKHVESSVLDSRRNLGRAVEENALLVYAKPAEMFKEKKEDEKGSTDGENFNPSEDMPNGSEEEEDDTKAASLAVVSRHSVPEHLVQASSWEYPGTKTWPYLLLRSHPSLHVHSKMIPQSEVQSAEHALRPRPVGEPDKHRYYLFEENGREELLSLRQVPTIMKRWESSQSLDLKFKFKDIVPLKHPHVDLDVKIPIQKELAVEDCLSDSDSDDEETRYKPVIPTVELCRNMFLNEEGKGDDNADQGKPKEEITGSAVVAAIRQAELDTNQEMDETRLREFVKFPLEIDAINKKTRNKELRIANFFS